MAFPASPTNGQSATVNGIVYTYNSTTNGWKRLATANSAVLSVAGTSTLWGVTSVVNQTQSTSTTTGALQVAGGVGIQGNLFVGGNLVAQGVNVISNVAGLYNSISNLGSYANANVVAYLGISSVTASSLSISSTTNNNGSTYASGALQVAGGAGFNGNVYVAGNAIVAGNTFMGGSLTANSNWLNLAQSTEVINNLGAAASTPVTCNLSTGATFYHSSVTVGSNWTVNFTNVPTTTERTIVVTIIIQQGTTAYVPTAVQIDGASQTIRWNSGSAPVGTVSGVDVVSFALIRTGGAWAQILGSYSGFA